MNLRADFKLVGTDFRPERADFRTERADFRPERAWRRWMDGWMDGRMDRQMDKRKCPCVLQDFVPFGAAAQKGGGENLPHV